MKEHNQLDNLRHSAAHLLAAAVMKMWPNTKRAIGPSIEDGFYFDFEFDQADLPAGRQVSEKDFPKIEKTMKQIVKTWDGFERHELSADDAKKEYPGNPYKHELVDEFSGKGEKLTFYKSGDYWDLCRGGHVDNPKKELQHFKLLSIAGAYWRGSEKNKMLTRIYATAFPTKEELDQHLFMLEEAKKRDHKKLGKELDLFVFSELVGPGLPLYTPKGTETLYEIKNFSRALRKDMGYLEVQTPQINKGQLFKISGHYDKFHDGMFRVVSHYSEEEYFMKPMNCPQHTQIYASRPRSYKDLPIKLADLAMLYRDEKPGQLSGLTRLRSFSQDDAHCFCREDQIEQEFDLLLQAIEKAMKTYGLNYYIRFSLRDENNKDAYLGSDEVWQKSQKLLEELLQKRKLDYKKAEGEAAFYGPKMDLIVKDSLGREWQLSTIQLDFNMPERFGLEYTDVHGQKAIPIMIHSALVGSPERFFGVAIEHFAGAFPVWLAPVQVKILPITDKQNEYAHELATELATEQIRVELDDRSESVGKKIRGAEMEKVPYMLIVGEKEVEAKSVAVRARNQKDLGVMKLNQFIDKIREEIKTRRLS
ncbi:MAG: threonine--tRNA ligase [Candidatus Doudnabacteria bacterium RIFCSPLOWO2_02_FULL_49_13]|uniref:Threonine--tRNA ligase n=1 Tax=Candidatus Doudnabacteria bacterium RIFCSPHIGHO2_12_FULL_48_16 TaxID=1817838 RepID=A0A1F5PLZ8_9BACT|nr:MAG: threonine--tRNA ligase [Candidatus Doudnabacteria bacterium RIFCSPHIGHO2_02_FULL_49_24]OGE88786.1 MAG: threonine--tRNA ligase [Candidatus Doudnabacteria bacterium RIFCSPHIGHO2_01_FULL_50_67]OGE90692.1 MAG: threonine--tRNA ligase [Candidatus Doudnabacteria bacterium RIFCSPHIGHO2_12_FULL_48_16]OGE97759.1 MAG: threonine--tRNA ligase [Candidatus Doudnabacteria bacterium RIFCSPLOWO2_01_FULL_49_40]OGF02556.1 MAG: threonine--tRNA ligase [Candidatus Doudnabacteria bacterium RIFCSPLOWO2_02_FULL_